MAIVRLVVALLVGRVVAWPQNIKELLRRIDEVVPKETLKNGIEREMRAALLLHDAQPELAASYLKRATDRRRRAECRRNALVGPAALCPDGASLPWAAPEKRWPVAAPQRSRTA
jgi:hypothetical protein